MARIPGGGIAARNPFGPDWGAKRGQETSGSQSVGQQVQGELFGKKKPPVLDEDDADISRLMGRLHTYRKKLARLAGDQESDYDLVLSAGTIASIDGEGLIYVGKNFLLNLADALEVQVGVLAHEIGHRPKRWSEYKQKVALTKSEKEELCRLEETRADYFAGKALAELDIDCEPLIQFLAAVQTMPHPEYFPPHVRADCIREGFRDGKRKAGNQKRFFPELARMTSAKGDLGIG